MTMMAVSASSGATTYHDPQHQQHRRRQPQYPTPTPPQQADQNHDDAGNKKKNKIIVDSTNNDDQSWRRPGKQFRRKLLSKDKSNSFTLNRNCGIEKYYNVADRVLDQFLQHPIDTRNDLIEAYLIGTRLSNFLSQVLPTHPEYFPTKESSSVQHHEDLVVARHNSQKQVAELVSYIEQIAVLIDRQEHELYISKVLLSSRQDSPSGSTASTSPSTSSSSSSRPSPHNQQQGAGEESFEASNNYARGNSENRSPPKAGGMARSSLPPRVPNSTKPPLSPQKHTTNNHNNNASTVPTISNNTRRSPSPSPSSASPTPSYQGYLGTMPTATTTSGSSYEHDHQEHRRRNDEQQQRQQQQQQRQQQPAALQSSSSSSSSLSNVLSEQQQQQPQQQSDNADSDDHDEEGDNWDSAWIESRQHQPRSTTAGSSAATTQSSTWRSLSISLASSSQYDSDDESSYNNYDGNYNHSSYSETEHNNDSSDKDHHRRCSRHHQHHYSRPEVQVMRSSSLVDQASSSSLVDQVMMAAVEDSDDNCKHELQHYQGRQRSFPDEATLEQELDQEYSDYSQQQKQEEEGFHPPYQRSNKERTTTTSSSSRVSSSSGSEPVDDYHHTSGGGDSWGRPIRQKKQQQVLQEEDYKDAHYRRSNPLRLSEKQRLADEGRNSSPPPPPPSHHRHYSNQTPPTPPSFSFKATDTGDEDLPEPSHYQPDLGQNNSGQESTTNDSYHQEKRRGIVAEDGTPNYSKSPSPASTRIIVNTSPPKVKLTPPTLHAPMARWAVPHREGEVSASRKDESMESNTDFNEQVEQIIVRERHLLSPITTSSESSYLSSVEEVEEEVVVEEDGVKDKYEQQEFSTCHPHIEQEKAGAGLFVVQEEKKDDGYYYEDSPQHAYDPFNSVLFTTNSTTPPPTASAAAMQQRLRHQPPTVTRMDLIRQENPAASLDAEPTLLAKRGVSYMPKLQPSHRDLHSRQHRKNVGGSPSSLSFHPPKTNLKNVQPQPPVVDYWGNCESTSRHRHDDCRTCSSNSISFVQGNYDREDLQNGEITSAASGGLMTLIEERWATAAARNRNKNAKTGTGTSMSTLSSPTSIAAAANVQYDDGEEIDEAMVNEHFLVKKRHPFSHFRDCVRCLVE